jgi:thioredoxin-related protein
MNRVVLLVLLFTVSAWSGCAQSSSEPADGAASLTPSSPAPFVWPSFDDAVAAAARSGKPILIDIYAPGCGWCRKMQAEVYGTAEIQAYVKTHFEYGRLNIDDAETQHLFKDYELTSQQLGYALGAQGTPTTVFLETNGDYITRLDGFWDLDGFGKAVRYIGSGAYLQQGYEEYLETAARGSG